MSRLRKAKKAYKLGRKGKLADRYQKYLFALQVRKENAIKITRATLASVYGTVQMKIIQQVHGLDPATKALKLAQCAIETANQVQRIMIGV